MHGARRRSSTSSLVEKRANDECIIACPMLCWLYAAAYGPRVACKLRTGLIRGGLPARFLAVGTVLVRVSLFCVRCVRG